MLKLLFSKDKEKRKTFFKVLEVTSSITSFAFAVLIGFVIGYYLDEYFHTSPLLTLVFGIFGIVAGVKNILEDLKKF